MSGNPFISAYLQSDGFGKALFWGLFILSVVTWVLIVHRFWIFFHMQKLSTDFCALFSEKEPLNLQKSPITPSSFLKVPHPFFEVYKTLKQITLKLMQKNQCFMPGQEAFVSEADLKLIESQVHASVISQAKKLDRNLFILSTISSLAPFLGLLGTVWGILLTFSQIHTQAISINNSLILSGLSLALTTTVLGLLVAIPSLIGYNLLKNLSKEYLRKITDFSSLLLAAVELRYRKPAYETEPASSR